MAGEMMHHGKSLFDFGPLAQVYDDWYATDEGMAHDRVQKRDVSALLETATGSQRLLDVGCGTGHWSRFFQSMGFEVRGVDISVEMVRAAQKNVPQARFDAADACHLPFADGCFDVAASITALEFIPDQAGAVSEMVRCTRPGGVVLIGTLNRIAHVNRDRLDQGLEPFASAKLLGPVELIEIASPLGELRMAASEVASASSDPVIVNPGNPPIPLSDLSGPLLVAHIRTASRTAPVS